MPVRRKPTPLQRGRGSASHVRVSSFQVPPPSPATATSSTMHPPKSPPQFKRHDSLSHLNPTWMFNFTLLVKEQTATHYRFLGKLVTRHFQINSPARVVCIDWRQPNTCHVFPARIRAGIFLFVTPTSCFYPLYPAVPLHSRKMLHGG